MVQSYYGHDFACTVCEFSLWCISGRDIKATRCSDCGRTMVRTLLHVARVTRTEFYDNDAPVVVPEGGECGTRVVPGDALCSLCARKRAEAREARDARVAGVE